MTTRAKVLAKPAATHLERSVAGRWWLRREWRLWLLVAFLAGVDVFLATYFEPGEPLSRPQTSGPPPSLVEAPELAVGDSPGPTPKPVSLELGGQVATLDHVPQMREAGMTWLKLQVKWEPGARGSDVASRIRDVQRRGFKVLLSVTGPAFPDEIDYDAYVEYLAEAAAYYPDAMEIWNEQNLAREWPVGQISGENYVNNMLAPAYNAIKQSSPDMLVISGALSPTGYFGGCQSEGCDDKVFFESMMAAGGYYYMDCVGVHFNSGATSPYDLSGHPADGGDGHYSWYYQSTYDVYNFLNLRPLCFTELGYVSPEGYGEIADTFAWASDTTVEQQARWLGETVALAHESDNVRLIVVYNLDFDYYGPDDPQAGFAIIRPDGSCPACGALAEALSF
jgi:hypothetical protein